MIGRFQILAVVLLGCGVLFAGDYRPETPVKDLIFTAFDTETTGFSAKNDRLVEIGAIRFRGNGEILAVTNWLVNPERPVPFYATEVHGITTEMVAAAPVFNAVFPLFEDFCKDSILLAHNATFDVGFLRAELVRAGLVPPALLIGDTLPLFRRWFPQAPSHSLEPLSLYLGVHNDTYHRAEADSFSIINIFNVGVKQHPGILLQQLEQDAGGFGRLDERKL